MPVGSRLVMTGGARSSLVALLTTSRNFFQMSRCPAPSGVVMGLALGFVGRLLAAICVPFFRDKETRQAGLSGPGHRVRLVLLY